MTSKLMLMRGLGASAILATPTAIAQFDDVSNWAAYDPGANGVGDHPEGYGGAVFDGRYVYFVPMWNGSAWHGEVLRHDTTGGYFAPGSWATYNPAANGIGSNPVGYYGGVFDGRFVYFTPHYRPGGHHGEFLRIDTTSEFANNASWSTFDPGNYGVGTGPEGYRGGAFDGRYVYFAPCANNTAYHGEVLRYDTTGEFGATSSWAAYDPGADGVGNNPVGYNGAVYDGRYVYFVPYHNDTSAHGEVLRHDTLGSFQAPSSWATYDYGAVCGEDCTDADGYAGAAYDGRYVYFAPFQNGTVFHGEVMRYDTAQAFSTIAAWATFDAGANGVGQDPAGYHGCAFDGRYVYFVPYRNEIGVHAEVLRYDTTTDFSIAGSWSAYDAGADGVGETPGGYFGAVYDQQRYVYFAPLGEGAEFHGEVLRYDTGLSEPIPAISEWGLAVMALLMLTTGAIVVMQRGRRPER